MKRSFKDLSAAEVLALAVSLEEEDARLLEEFARRLRPNYPKAAAALDAMRKEEDGHRHRLTELFRRRSTARRFRCCGGRTCGASCGAIRCNRCGLGTSSAFAARWR